LSSYWQRRKFALLLFLPCLLILLGVVIFPLAYSVGLTFVHWNMRFAGTAPTLAGVDNWVRAFADARLLNALGNTVLLVVVAIPVECFLGLAVASMLQARFRGKFLVTALVLLPVTISEAVTGLVWGLMLDATYGPVMYILRVLGFLSQGYDIRFHYPMEMVILADIWNWTPFFIIIFLAAISALPVEPFEGAEVDRATTWQTFRYLTLPMLLPVMGIALIIRLVDAFKTFGVPYVLTMGGPGTASETISLYIFYEGTKFFDMVYAATLSWVLIIIVNIVVNLFIRAYRFKV
jgi:multiple sugar transport system permease protein